MPNPPYSGSCIILYENQDGINVRVYHYGDLKPGTPIPKGIVGLENSLFAGLNLPPPDGTGADSFTHRHAQTRTALKTAFGNYVDTNFPDTPA